MLRGAFAFGAGMSFDKFIEAKRHEGSDSGFDPTFIPDFLFDFQKSMVEWAVRKGRGALFEDCGMGKTPQFLVWAQNVVFHTNKPVLILTTLAVSIQIVREGDKFGIDVKRSTDGSISSDIVVSNYERLHHFDWTRFSGVICDESSILKSFDGAIKDSITDFMRKVPYRLLATATAAPNDYIELGTSSEALGYLGYMDMLNRFFKNDLNNSATKRMYGEAPKWRFKGHAERPFWQWVCSWARAIRKPSDLGFDDGPFVLPKLTENQHFVHSENIAEGMLFALPASTLPEQREEKKRTVVERCEKAASLVEGRDSSILWCHMNAEGDILEEIVPDSVQISGSDSDEAKEEKFLSFLDGGVSRLITKPKIGALGLNFQHCAHATYFPSHSYEQYYQAVRREWRFGQKREVVIDIVHTEGEKKILANLLKKGTKAEEMFVNLIAEMNNGLTIKPRTPVTRKIEVPSWI
jgi:hypothetical protein